MPAQLYLYLFMANNKLPEVWLRGPLSDIPALLQPVAYALLQAREELNALMITFPDELLWNKVAGMASPGFHLQHLTGVLDRLFTYARAETLNEEQVTYLSTECKPTTKIYNAIELVEAFNKQVDEALTQLSNVDETTLTDFRG